MPDPARLLVMAPNWLGDAVMSLPAIADLRRRYPSAHLAVAARGSVAPMFELSDLVNDVIALRWKGSALDRFGYAADVWRLRDERFDAAVLLPNSFASAWLARQAGIAERSGYARDWRSPLLTQPIPRPRGSRHQGAYYQHLVRLLGASNGPLESRLAAAPADLDAARALLVQGGWDGVRRLVALAPGAAYGTAKRWLPEHYATLVTGLVVRRGVTCVLVGGPADAEATRTVRDTVAAEARGQVIDLASRTTLRALAGVLSSARVCVSNDSGAMHLAAALGARVIALFGATREYETAPLSWAERPATVLIHQVWCRPCMLRECPIDHRCMRGLTPERVGAAVADAIEAAV